jgi:hypothetical protein
MVRLAQASKDENGRYADGKAGNQTGSELNIRAWYNRPWDTVLRPISVDLGKQIAHVAQILVKNNRIGYDQHQRTTAYDQCSKINWDINKINKIEPCECDCSSLIAVILKFCGISIPKTVYTGNLTSYLMRTGKFLCLRESKYLIGDRYLREGDIVLNTTHHVAVCLDNGEKTVAAPFVSYAAQVNVNTYLNVRIGPGAGYACMKINGKDFQLPNGLIIAICEEANGWGRLSDLQGWVSLSYLVRATS